MPICSYVVFPRSGHKAQVVDLLETVSGCHTEAATEDELLLLLTETADEAAEEALQLQLKSIESIQCMVLTFGDIAVPQAGDPA